MFQEFVRCFKTFLARFFKTLRCLRLFWRGFLRLFLFKTFLDVCCKSKTPHACSGRSSLCRRHPKAVIGVRSYGTTAAATATAAGGGCAGNVAASSKKGTDGVLVSRPTQSAVVVVVPTRLLCGKRIYCMPL
jgi:hypothetical protein